MARAQGQRDARRAGISDARSRPLQYSILVRTEKTYNKREMKE